MNTSSKLRKFRPATMDDADHIIDQIVEINKKVGAVYGIPMDAESVIATVIHTIERGVCVVGENACAGGYIHPYPWNHAAKIGLILFWNYTRPSGIRVFEAIAERFRALGATHINAASHFPDNRIGQYYARFRLHPAEVQHIGCLSAMKTNHNTPKQEEPHVVIG